MVSISSTICMSFRMFFTLDSVLPNPLNLPTEQGVSHICQIDLVSEHACCAKPHPLSQAGCTIQWLFLLPHAASLVSIRTFQFGHLVTTSLTRGEGQCDGRCVQTSGRHSYNLAGPTITTDSRLTVSSSRRRAQHDPRTM